MTDRASGAQQPTELNGAALPGRQFCADCDTVFTTHFLETKPLEFVPEKPTELLNTTRFVKCAAPLHFPSASPASHQRPPSPAPHQRPLSEQARSRSPAGSRTRSSRRRRRRGSRRCLTSSAPASPSAASS